MHMKFFVFWQFLRESMKLWKVFVFIRIQILHSLMYLTHGSHVSFGPDTWFAFIDSDEYIVPNAGELFLRHIVSTMGTRDYCEVQMPYVRFGDAGLQKQPDSVIKTFHRAAIGKRYPGIKSLARRGSVDRSSRHQHCSRIKASHRDRCKRLGRGWMDQKDDGVRPCWWR